MLREGYMTETNLMKTVFKYQMDMAMNTMEIYIFSVQGCVWHIWPKTNIAIGKLRDTLYL